jgi:SAM-dependent methyltransferase
VRRAVDARRLLRWLLRLDNLLYHATTRAAVWSGGGVHPKRRLTGYHAFFVARVEPGDRVLDIGCGDGALAAALARERDARVTGLDRDGAAIRAARAAWPDPRLDFVEGAARHLPAGKFDVVVLSNVLEHLDARTTFLRETVEHTGARRLLIRVPLFERDWRVPLKRELGVDYRLDPTHRIEYTLAELDAELAAAGLAVEERLVRWGEIWAACRVRP